MSFGHYLTSTVKTIVERGRKMDKTVENNRMYEQFYVGLLSFSRSRTTSDPYQTTFRPFGKKGVTDTPWDTIVTDSKKESTRTRRRLDLHSFGHILYFDISLFSPMLPSVRMNCTSFGPVNREKVNPRK